VTWCHAVRFLAGWTETKLEAFFTEPERAAKATSRPTRWNKYRFGRASPPRDLLEPVNEKFPATLAVHDHVVWTLADLQQPSSEQLRQLAERLTPRFADLLLDPKVTKLQLFWRRCDISPRALITVAGLQADGNHIAYMEAVAALLWIAHEGVLRQDELQHFESYVAIVHAAQGHYERVVVNEPMAGRLEAHLFANWLDTNYRTLHYARTVHELRRLQTGPQAHWIKSQKKLILSDESRLTELRHSRDQRGYWAARKLAELRPVPVLDYSPR
jgi:hypothetical protein